MKKGFTGKLDRIGLNTPESREGTWMKLMQELKHLAYL